MNLKSKITALNSLLSDIYEIEDARVSQLPARAGFDARDIQTLRSRHMAKLADKLREIVEKQVKTCEFEIRPDKDSGAAIILRPLNQKGRPEIVVTESNAQVT